jgi:hypothetical protein
LHGINAFKSTASALAIPVMSKSIAAADVFTMRKLLCSRCAVAHARRQPASSKRSADAGPGTIGKAGGLPGLKQGTIGFDGGDRGRRIGISRIDPNRYHDDRGDKRHRDDLEVSVATGRPQ